MAHANDCGNRVIDQAAERGRWGQVWSRLEHIFPEVRHYGNSIWLARRDGTIRRAIGATHEGGDVDLRNPPASGDAWHWRALRTLCMEAIEKDARLGWFIPEGWSMTLGPGSITGKGTMYRIETVKPCRCRFASHTPWGAIDQARDHDGITPKGIEWRVALGCPKGHDYTPESRGY